MNNINSGEIVEIEEIETLPNLAFSERLISIGAGTYMIFNGLSKIFRKPLIAVSEVAIGGALLYRGSLGYCAITEYCTQKEIEEVEV